MRRIIALLASLTLALGIGLFGSSPAQAAGVSADQCWKGGYQFVGTKATSRYSGNVIRFDWARVQSLHGQPLEYRVRWFGTGGGLIYDSGYHTTGATDVYVYPGVQRVMGAGSNILINAGALWDGLATCEIWLAGG